MLRRDKAERNYRFEGKMSKRTKKTATFAIDGKISQQIVKKDKDGNEEWVKFQATEPGIQITPHFIKEHPEQNHLDIYENGKKIGTMAEPFLKPAGVAMNIKTKELHPLPPMIMPVELYGKLSERQLAELYVRRVKLVK